MLSLLGSRWTGPIKIWDYPSPIIELFFVSCFDIGEVPRSPWKWNWNLLYFLPFIFTFEQCAVSIGFSMETNGKGADNSFPGNIMKNKFY